MQAGREIGHTTTKQHSTLRQSLQGCCGSAQRNPPFSPPQDSPGAPVPRVAPQVLTTAEQRCYPGGCVSVASSKLNTTNQQWRTADSTPPWCRAAAAAAAAAGMRTPPPAG
eukprot:TRINITY_DN23212_c0_g1_i1.p1 TRINITY_DN23212_c0_g1~~TRINITY_DN23212_c0_g1_i1.p1  ORF type:complete len:111 (-),score=19.34 TRINITY_DN23212_c0_g1_i1:43-375(-)